MNNTLSADALSAASNITENVYSGFDIVSTAPILLGGVFIVALIFSIVFMPKHIKRLIYGYVGILIITILWSVAYGLFKSMGSITKVGVGFLQAIGEFLISYWIILCLSLPVAYLIGSKIETGVDNTLNNMSESEVSK